MLLSPCYWFCTSDSQNCKIISLCCFKLLNVWWFVIAAMLHILYIYKNICYMYNITYIMLYILEACFFLFILNSYFFLITIFSFYHLIKNIYSVRFSQSCPTLATPWIAACQAFLSITNSRSLLKIMLSIIILCKEQC